jgi:hypothetical protein
MSPATSDVLPVDPPADGGSTNRLCCCPPTARVFISTQSSGFAVENSIHEEHHFEEREKLDVSTGAGVQPKLESRAASNASVGNPPGGPASSADGMGANRVAADSASDARSSLDDHVRDDKVVRKDQAKVYRIDQWQIEWEARGDGDLRVALRVSGVIDYRADWLPKSGVVRLARNYMLHPPLYDPGGPAELVATLQVSDCCRQSATQTSRAPRP